MRRLTLAILLAVLISLPVTILTEATAAPAVEQTESASSVVPTEGPGADRLVLAFYYAWYDANTWQPGKVADMPVATYNSADRSTIARHVDMAKAAGIDVLVQSWLGPNNPTDSNFATLLSVAQEKGFRATIDFESNSSFLPNADAARDALRYAIDKYSGQPSFLHYQGKPVIFFWHTRQYGVDTWRQIRDQVDPDHATVWIAEGDDPSYLQVFDGIHMYSIAWSSDPAGTLSAFANKVTSWESQLRTPKLWVATVMPGYDDRTTGRPDAFVRDRQNGQYYISTWNAAIATSPDWIIITSFNEWVEGTMIEPSVTYGDQYLNLTRDMAARFKAGTPRVVGASASNALDFDIPNGHFFTEANGQPLGQQAGTSPVGFAVTNDGGVELWNEYQRLGGVQGLGYPISQRFQWDGFVVQAMQKGVLQWHPDVGQAYLVNIFDQMSAAGKDDWLAAARSTPRPLGPDFDAGKTWPQIVQARLALLDNNPAIKQRYYSVSDPMTTFGLPTSRVEDGGDHYSIRLERAVIQQWKVDVPWAKAGDVVVANGGDVGKDAGLYPSAALTPQSP